MTQLTKAGHGNLHFVRRTVRKPCGPSVAEAAQFETNALHVVAGCPQAFRRLMQPKRNGG